MIKNGQHIEQDFSKYPWNTCVPACDFAAMAPNFIAMLTTASGFCDVEFVINSAFRSPLWERNHGRTGSSAHCKGLAVDIRAVSSRDRFHIVSALLQAGFMRIGIGKNFVHVDWDSSKPQFVMFHYYG